MNNWSPILGLPRSSLRVAGEVPVNSLWKQAFATALAPACKSGAAALGSHTCAKTVLAFTRTLRWLKSAFHYRELAGSDLRALTVGARPVLSTTPNGNNSAARPISCEPLLFSIAQEALIYNVANRANF